MSGQLPKVIQDALDDKVITGWGKDKSPGETRVTVWKGNQSATGTGVGFEDAAKNALKEFEKATTSNDDEPKAQKAGGAKKSAKRS